MNQPTTSTPAAPLAEAAAKSATHILLELKEAAKGNGHDAVSFEVDYRKLIDEFAFYAMQVHAKRQRGAWLASGTDLVLRFADEPDFRDTAGVPETVLKALDQYNPKKQVILALAVPLAVQPKEPGKKTFATHAVIISKANSLVFSPVEPPAAGGK